MNNILHNIEALIDISGVCTENEFSLSALLNSNLILSLTYGFTLFYTIKIVKGDFDRKSNNPTIVNTFSEYKTLVVETYLFSMLMYLFCMIFISSISISGSILLYSTMSIYTTVFPIVSLLKSKKLYLNKVEGKKGAYACPTFILFLALVNVILNFWLIYKGHSNGGDYWWLLSWFLSILSLSFKMIEATVNNIFKSNATGAEMYKRHSCGHEHHQGKG